MRESFHMIRNCLSIPSLLISCYHDSEQREGGSIDRASYVCRRREGVLILSFRSYES